MTILLDHRLVFADVEVAGADISRPIIQVAAIAVSEKLQELETFEAKLKFDETRADPRSLTPIRYRRNIWETEARTATSVARGFAKFLARHATVTSIGQHGKTYQVAQLVAHNAYFDGPFLHAWFTRVGRYFPGHYRMLCTVQRAMWLFQENPDLRPPPYFKLATLCGYFGVPLDPQHSHTALADVQATVEIYRRITMFGAAELANDLSRRSLKREQHGRVACVATARPGACLSRRKRKRNTCRLRRTG